MEMHSEKFSALDDRLDALLHGGAVVDLDDELPESLELHELIAVARLTMEALGASLSPVTQARHLRMLEAAAARWGPEPPHTGGPADRAH